MAAKICLVKSLKGGDEFDRKGMAVAESEGRPSFTWETLSNDRGTKLCLIAHWGIFQRITTTAGLLTIRFFVDTVFVCLILWSTRSARSGLESNLKNAYLDYQFIIHSMNNKVFKCPVKNVKMVLLFRLVQKVKFHDNQSSSNSSWYKWFTRSRWWFGYGRPADWRVVWTREWRWKYKWMSIIKI